MKSIAKGFAALFGLFLLSLVLTVAVGMLRWAFRNFWKEKEPARDEEPIPPTGPAP